MWLMKVISPRECRQKCEPADIWTIYIEITITGQFIDAKQKHEEGK